MIGAATIVAACTSGIYISHQTYHLRNWSGSTRLVPVSVMYIVHSILLCITTVVVIITQPMDVTVCLTQSTTASFTCVIDRGGVDIFSAGWQILTGGQYQSVIGRPRHMVNPTREGDIITDTLIVTDVSVNDNGALYQCQPGVGVTSRSVTITVLGEIIICLSHTHNYCTYVFVTTV